MEKVKAKKKIIIENKTFTFSLFNNKCFNRIILYVRCC